VADAAPKPDIPVQLIAMNDFHGRISETDGADSQIITGPGDDGVYGPNPERGNKNDDKFLTVGGSAHVAATVHRLKGSFAEETGGAPGSFFVGAGDLISASTFESSVFKDEPTIEALNAMGLDVSAVGNHEFDRGTDELRRISDATNSTDRVEQCPATLGGDPFVVGTDGCFGTGEHAFEGAQFPYLAANVISRSTGQPMLPPYQIFDVGGGKKLALIGVVTETTPTIVSPDGVRDVQFIDEAEAVNRWVPVLRQQGIQAIGVLIHEGGQVETPDPAADYINACRNLSGPIVDLNDRIDPQVDLIVSAHSHQAYNCRLKVAGGQKRLVTQAGFYGRLVTDIRLEIDAKTGDVNRNSARYTAANVPVVRQGAGDAEVASIVSYWKGQAAEAGDRLVGKASATIGNSASSGRSSEQPIGNLVAQAQWDAMQEEQFGLPVIAFMNPGGVRKDILKGDVTYGEVYAVQPFGNTVDTITLTGADIDDLLEQQFQADPDGAGPLPPAGPRGTQLILGTNKGFTYSYDLSRAYGDRVDDSSIRLDGAVIAPTVPYRVAANSFLVQGGDSFTAFRNGTAPTTGPVDVDVLVEYFKANSPVSPPLANHSTKIG
jgi:5'-nucleotidase